MAALKQIANLINPGSKKKGVGLSPSVESKISKSDRFFFQFVGTALPGTNKAARGNEIAAATALGRTGRFADIPSSGGFTILGKNAFGQQIARDNVTGQVRPVSGFIPISPAAKGLGEQKTPQSLAQAAEGRRRDRTRRGRVTSRTTKQPKPNLNVLGNESILGNQSILG